MATGPKTKMDRVTGVGREGEYNGDTHVPPAKRKATRRRRNKAAKQARRRTR